MGLMDGLSHWLRQIIAVVLLASLIDLILPNRTMQRYVRLVAGLFILMTVATPIMNWMKGDFSSQLAASLNSVEQVPQGAADELAMIEAEGAKLRNRQTVQAAELVSARLESAIIKEVEQAENQAVQKVDVAVEQEADGTFAVTKVFILLESNQEKTELAASEIEVSDVDPIAAVDIRIEVESWPREQESIAAEASELEVDRETQTRVSALIASRFGISTRMIEVKQQDTEKANADKK